MFDKKDTLKHDEEQADLACGDVERLISVIKSSQENIEATVAEFQPKLRFYENQIKRLRKASEFCGRLLATSEIPETTKTPASS